MSDLSSMIDDTTERLLKKIDNWEIPQSDKKYVTIEKEVWEATLRRSMENTAKVETLQKQLEIAFEGLAKYACPIYAGGNSYLNDNGKLAREYIDKIEKLNEIHKQE